MQEEKFWFTSVCDQHYLNTDMEWILLPTRIYLEKHYDLLKYQNIFTDSSLMQLHQTITVVESCEKGTATQNRQNKNIHRGNSTTCLKVYLQIASPSLSA